MTTAIRFHPPHHTHDMRTHRIEWLRNPFWLYGALTLVTAVISAQSVMADMKTFAGSNALYTQYNNYLIFRQSFVHLISNQDLYRAFPAEHWDLFKYSPAFALAMAPFSVLPDLEGLLLWNLCNALVLFAALWAMPSLSPGRRVFLLAFVSLPLVSSIQAEQSNALVAGLMIGAFVLLERERVAPATLCIALSVAIKLFGVVSFALLLFYPGRVRAIGWSLLWLVLLALVPLLVIDASQLASLYRSWLDMLAHDESVSFGTSAAGWLYSWFGVSWKQPTLIAGVVLFCLPLLRVPMYRDQRFRMLTLASLLIWVVIFNHKAESPTYVIAAAGVAIWCAASERSLLNDGLLALAFIFTVLSTTEAFPRPVRAAFVVPYMIKAVPCVLVWLRIVWEQLTLPADAAPRPQDTSDLYITKAST